MMSVSSLSLEAIRADQRAQPREHLSTEITEAYAEAMTKGDEFPPLLVFQDNEGIWLADGFPRRYAALGIGVKHFDCIVKTGGLREAILQSCQVNASHGFRRSNDDKRRSTLKLLQDDEWSRWSDNEIATRANVSAPFVAKLRGAHGSAERSPQERTYKTNHGTVAVIKTGAIGKTPSTGRRAQKTGTGRPDSGQPTSQSSRTSPQRGREAICDRVREAVTILSGLPPAHEVAGYFAGTDAASLVFERLRPAAAWLADFSDAWKDDQC